MSRVRARERPRLRAVGLFILVAFTLRVWGLGWHSVWLDEALMLGRSTADALTAAQGRTPLDLAPPLFPLFLHAWTWLGESDFLVRFPSVVFSTLAVAVLARAIPQAGLGAALIFALAPVQIHYAQEATTYALVGLLAALALLTATWIEQGDRRGWPAFGAVAVVSAYTYYGLLFLVVGLYVREVARRWTMDHGRPTTDDRRPTTHFSLLSVVRPYPSALAFRAMGGRLRARPSSVALIVALACLPLLPLAGRQSAATVDAWWGQYGQLDGMRGGHIFVQGLLAHGLAFPLFPFSRPPLWLLMTVGCLLALSAARRPRLFLAGWLGPLAVAYVASAWGRYPFETRYLLFAAPSLYALLASAFSPTTSYSDKEVRGLSTVEAQWPQRADGILYSLLGVFASLRLGDREAGEHRSLRVRVPLVSLIILAVLLISAWPVWGLDLPWSAQPPSEEVRSLLTGLAERRAPDDAVYVSYGARAAVEHYQRLGLAPWDIWLEEGWPAGRVEIQAEHALTASKGRRVWVLVAHAALGEEQALAEALARRGAWLRERVVAPGAALWGLETGD